MNCASDGTLRARVDGELSGPDLKELDQHLATCAVCCNRMDALAQEATRTQTELALLRPSPNQCGSDVQAAYRQLQARARAEGTARPSLLARLFVPGWRPAWGVVAVVCAVMAILSFSAGRTWAQRLLGMLRVQKITVVPVDFSAPPSGSREQEANKLLSQMISDEVVTLKEPGKPQIVADAKTASVQAGFRVRSATTNLGAPQQIVVRGESAFQMTLNRDRIAAILQEVGRSDIELPNAINGATVSVHIPSSVLQLYGDCKNEVAAIARMEQNNGGPANRDTGRLVSNEGCINFGQVPSPAVAVPPNVNIADLAQAGLQLAGMSAGEARSFTQTVDWSSTLVIPVPRNISSYQKVPVDGVEGTLIQTDGRNGRSPRYGLFWVKNGIVYSIHGRGSADQGLLLASSLR